MLEIFRKTAWFEGVSLILLLFFAMPMKYLAGQDIFVKTIGMAHGLLFIVYMLLAITLKFSNPWNYKKFGIICLASISPFGTFYIESKYLNKD
jgi:integral membrane protein